MITQGQINYKATFRSGIEISKDDFLFVVIVAKRFRGAAFPLFKNAIEIGDIIKSAFKADFGN